MAIFASGVSWICRRCGNHLHTVDGSKWIVVKGKRVRFCPDCVAARNARIAARSLAAAQSPENVTLDR